VNRVSAWLSAFHDGLTRLGLVLGTGALGLIVASYGYEVGARYLFNAPTEWASEFVPYLLCASVFLMMPEMTRSGAHVAVTVVIENAPRHTANILERLTLLFGFLACALAGWISLDENVRQIVNDVQLLGTYIIPKWWVSTLITYGLISSAVYFLRSFWNTIFRSHKAKNISGVSY